MAIIVLKGLLASDEDASIIRGLDVFQQVGEASKVVRFELEPDQLFDAALLGHGDLVLDQGPLTVAALGINPPDRSLHFHVSLLSTSGDTISSLSEPPSAIESMAIRKALAKLSTKNLTVLIGEGADHALVSDRLMEIRTSKPTEAKTNGLEASMPIGEGDTELRRFIDDSINLLAEEEFNARRIDLGVLPINLAWPWGQGERPRVANRALALGYPWIIRANSFALRGLAKLSGFRPEKLPQNFLETLSLIKQEASSLTLLELGGFKEDRERVVSDVATQFLAPLFQWQLDSRAGLVVVATGQREGLAAFFAKPNERDNFPFDKRSIFENRVERFALQDLLELG